MNKFPIDNSNKINELRSSDQKEIETKRAQKTEKAASQARSGSDEIKLSNRASESSKFTAQVAAFPDVRADLVQKFGGLVSEGGYNPSSGDIADALIAEEF